MRLAWCALLAMGCGYYPSGDDDNDPPPQSDAGPRTDAGMIPDLVLARVVIDGDTIIVSAGSHLKTPDGRALDGETIRMIGVDAPEIEHPPTPADCYGDEAKIYTQEQIGGRTVELTYDLANGVRDVYDRLLAYVARDGAVHNENMIRTGNGRAFRNFYHRELDHYVELEREARAEDLGLWTCP